NKIYPHSALGQIPFMIMAFYLLVVCMLMQIILSYCYPVEHNAESGRLYWKSPLEPLKDSGWNGLGNYKILSVVLLMIMVALYILFR
ncbi:MAG TPA: sodium:solute symporter, partial [Chitinophagaceae bacterium]|nr:sodium:solute symporter [Chitinophagaceae bacterium]